MQAVRFLAELSKRREIEIHPVPRPVPGMTNGSASGIYRINISEPPEESYWTEWGGYYDSYAGAGIEIYYRRFLSPVETLEDLHDNAVNYAVYTDRKTFDVYIKISMHPWIYPDYGTQVADVAPFVSAALNPDNPSDNILRGVKDVKADARLALPNFTVSLSEGLSGISLNQGFNLNFINNDGFFDKDSEWDLFNTPARLFKSFKDSPAREDFRPVREGFVNSTGAGFPDFAADVADKLKALSNPVCDILDGETYNGVRISEDSLGRQIPVVYGKKKIGVINVDGEDSYLAAEFTGSVRALQTRGGETLPHIFDSINNIIRFDYSAVGGVYGRNNNPLGYDIHDNHIQVRLVGGNWPPVDHITGRDGGIIPHRNAGEGVIKFAEAGAAVIDGYAANKIGEIIRDLAVRKGRRAYISSFWNTAETNAYTAQSPEANIAFDRGDVKSAVQKVLKSDMAYLIQQSDGKFTIRKWGGGYPVHALKPWVISNRPRKNFNAASERYFSSCVILYESGDGETKSRYVFTELAQQAEIRYRKLKEAEFETDLARREAAAALARLLGDRYTTMRHVMTLPVGADTSGMELLDGLEMEIDINGRRMSESKKYIITGINPAQDILTIEEACYG